MREIILDTETTGLDPKEGHKVIEIGGIEMINKVLTGNKFHMKNFCAKISGKSRV